jgi:hypothetical protein
MISRSAAMPAACSAASRLEKKPPDTGPDFCRTGGHPGGATGALHRVHDDKPAPGRGQRVVLAGVREAPGVIQVARSMRDGELLGFGME